MNSTVAISGQPADLCELKLCRRSSPGQWSALLLGEVGSGPGKAERFLGAYGVSFLTAV